MNLFFLIATLSPFLLLIDATTYYVNEESLATDQTGSLTNPFTSIDQAYLSLGAITCDLVLLGSSASISTTIAFKLGSNYTIRPDTSFTSSAYFPIYLQSGAVITVTSAVLTLQKLQLRELNPSRTTNTPLFTTTSTSNLTFQSILMRGTRTTASYYFFCKATDSFVNIIDSEFRNLTDFTTSLVRSPIVVRGSTFTDLSPKTTGFMSQAYYKGPSDGFAFKNNSFQNITIGQKSQNGFIYSLLAHINITFEDFYINNVTFTQQTPFLGSVASSSAYYDVQNDQTTMTIKNGVIQNMYEKPEISLDSATKGLFVNTNQQTIMKVHNLTVTNSIFSNLSLVSFTSYNPQFANVWKVLPYVELTDITLKYTRNANFIIYPADTVNISNVYLEGLSIKDVTTTYATFRFSSGHLMNVYNVTVKNVTGPVFGTSDVLAHNFSTLSFNEIYTSQKLDSFFQSAISFYLTTDLVTAGLDPSRSQDNFFDNINLNGYTYIDETDTKNANYSFFINGQTIYGKVYLTNSVWHNNFLNGFNSRGLPYFEVDNLTIDHDPDIPRDSIPQHKGFYLRIAKEIVFKNSVFRDNQNFVVLHWNNIASKGATYQTTETHLTLENITVLNNSAVFYDADSQYSSLFIINSLIKSVTVFFQNSYFYNNTILNGLINSLENYQANMDFTNNTFDSNYATQAAAVFSSTNMRQTTSAFNLTNNTFINNRCDQNGGVFYFIQTDYKMHPVNNTYFNNTAGLAGGVGYAFRASFVFLEEEGAYQNNSAGSFGGVWYISLNTYKASLQSLKFSQTSFINSLAQQKGGSIYLDNGGMTINQCIFNGSKAEVAGGNLYIAIGKSINMIYTNFTGSSAPEGSFLYAEDIGGTLTLNNVQMKDISSSGFILGTSSGSLNITDSVFENINSSLFLLSGVTTSITSTTFNQISCPKTSNSFCLLKTTSTSDSVEIVNTFFTNIYSDVDLISLSNCAQALLSSVTAQNMLKLTQENIDQIFVLNTLNVQTLNIDQSDFSQIGLSGVKVKKTNINPLYAQNCFHNEDIVMIILYYVVFSFIEDSGSKFLSLIFFS